MGYRGGNTTSSASVVGTGTAGAPQVLTAADTGKVFTNTGAGAKAYFTLPPTALDLQFTFVVSSVNGLRVVAAAAGAGNSANDNIQAGTVAGKAAGYVESTAVGSVIRLRAVDATVWIVEDFVGTWTVET
jgi:hypothetical protein